MYKVCMEWKAEYESLHLRPISVYCSINRRIRELSRKYTGEIPKDKAKLTDEGVWGESILTYMHK